MPQSDSAGPTHADPVAAPTTAKPAEGTARRGIFILLTTIVASAMVFIDGNVVTVALPALRTAFDADVAAMQWVVEGYLLTLTALLLVSGALGDGWGRKRVFLAGLALFTVASVACGLAQTIGQLIAARAVQGIGGALLVPGSLAIITACFEGAQRNRAIGTWSAYSAIMVAVAPLLGGWLIEVASWRAIFYINVPLALIAGAAAWRWVPESRSMASGDGRVRIDWTGAALATVGLAGLVFALIELPRLGAAHPAVVGAGLAGMGGVIAFLMHEARTPAPMMPLDLFRDRVFAAANLLTLTLYAALGGVMFMLPLHLISVRGFTALEAGAALLPFIAVLSLLSRIVGALTDRIGARRLLTAGPVLAAGGLVALALPGLDGGYWTDVFPGVTALGVGMGLTVAPLTATVMNTAAPGRGSLASAINNTVSRLAWLLAVALLGGWALFWFTWSLDGQVGDLAGRLGDEIHKLGAAVPPPDLPTGPATILGDAIALAALDAFRAVALVCAGLALLSGLIALVLLPPRPRAT